MSGTRSRRGRYSGSVRPAASRPAACRGRGCHRSRTRGVAVADRCCRSIPGNGHRPARPRTGRRRAGPRGGRTPRRGSARPRGQRRHTRLTTPSMVPPSATVSSTTATCRGAGVAPASPRRRRLPCRTSTRLPRWLAAQSGRCSSVATMAAGGSPLAPRPRSGRRPGRARQVLASAASRSVRTNVAGSSTGTTRCVRRGAGSRLARRRARGPARMGAVGGVGSGQLAEPPAVGGDGRGDRRGRGQVARRPWRDREVAAHRPEE